MNSRDLRLSTLSSTVETSGNEAYSYVFTGSYMGRLTSKRARLYTGPRDQGRLIGRLQRHWSSESSLLTAVEALILAYLCPPRGCDIHAIYLHVLSPPNSKSPKKMMRCLFEAVSIRSRSNSDSPSRPQDRPCLKGSQKSLNNSFASLLAESLDLDV